MFESKTERAEVVEITPEIAAKLLATSPGNRTLRDGYIKTLMGAMERGEWRVTSQGIAIDNLGRLRDAHHRLTAVVRSGVTIKTVVVYGLRPDSYEVTDTGITRTHADLLSLPRDQASILRLAGEIYFQQTRVTADQLRIIDEAGIVEAADRLLSFCALRVKYYASMPVRLAACTIMIESPDSIDYVLEQYRALCQLDFARMSPASQAFVRAAQGRVGSGRTSGREWLARGLKVFDPEMSELSRIVVMPETTAAAAKRLRNAIEARIIKEGA